MKKPLDKADITGITEAYYSRFCCADIARIGEGASFVCSAEREEILPGYGCAMTLCLLERSVSLICAYAPKHAAAMEKLRGAGRDEIVSFITEEYRPDVKRLFVFNGERLTSFGTARALAPEDYPAYEEFFRAAMPDSDPEGWLCDYFTEKAEKGLFYGSFEGETLAAVSDAPDMPYMDGLIQHTGIITLPGYRRRGHAASAAGLAAHRFIARGICPQWDCAIGNAASAALAEKLGYVPYATAYIVEEYQ